MYHGNLKFYQKLNLQNDKKNIICFASIHREEFENVVQIIKNLDLNFIEQVIIIPRHIHFSSKLKSMIKNFYLNKIFILEKFGENNIAYENSKLTFMEVLYLNMVVKTPLNHYLKVVLFYQVNI